MRCFLFFTAALVSATHLNSEKNVTITQITNECTESLSCSSATASSSISGTSLTSALDTLSSSAPKTLSSNTLGSSRSVTPDAPSHYTYDSSQSNTLSSTWRSTFSSPLSDSSSISLIATNNTLSSCTAGLNCTSPAPSNRILETSSSSVSEVSSGSTVKISSSSTSDSKNHVPVTSSAQQESQSCISPESTMTITRTRTRTKIMTYYVQPPISKSWQSEQSEPSIHTVHSWHNTATMTSATGVVTDTTTAIPMDAIADTITITITDTTIATVTRTITDMTTATATITTYTSYGVPESVYRSCQVSHHGFYNTTAPQANYPIVSSQSPQPWSSEYALPVTSIMAAESFVTGSRPIIPKLNVPQNTTDLGRYPTSNRVMEPSSTSSLQDESIATQASATESSTLRRRCLLDQNTCQSSDGSLMNSEFHEIEKPEMSRVLPSKAVSGLPSESNFQSKIPLVQGTILARDYGNRSVEQSKTVIDHANRPKITSVSEQTNPVQADHIHHHPLPMIDELNDVAWGPVSKQLVPLQEEIWPSSARPDPNSTAHHNSSTAIITNTTANTSIRVVSSPASSMECPYVALVIAMTMLVL